MNNRPVRYRGTDFPVIERFRIGGRTYLAIAKLGAAGRRAYQVYDTAAKTMRALHVLPDSDAMLKRVRTLQRLTRGDNEIIQIIEFRRQDDHIWVVLTWIDGFNLRSVLNGIREHGKQRIAAPEAVRLVKGVAHVLAHFHRHKGIIHGDIKPANLILTKRTSLVLIDFGNAWTLETTATRGGGDGVSGVYAAPEFARGDIAVGSRADYFSLGVVLYEILTDRIPYDGHGGKVGVLPQSVRSESRLVPASVISPERDKLPKRILGTIDRLLERSLSVNPSDRFATTHEWLDAWGAALESIRQTSKDSTSPSIVARLFEWIANRRG